MLRIHRVGPLSLAAIAGLAFAGAAQASIIASDSASNSPPYTAGTGDTAGTEFNGLNGGSGFGAWVVTDTENYTGVGATTSTLNGNGGAFVNSTTNDATRNPAPVFDVFDNGNPNSSTPTGAALGSSIESAMRPFLSPIGVGGSFTFTESLANLRGANAGVPTSLLGFQLLDASGNVLLDLHASGGGAGYDVTDANQTNLQLFSTDAAHSGSSSRALTINTNSSDILTITINDAAGDFTITSTGHEGSTFADGGQINLSTGGPAAFVVYNNNGGDGSDIRVNNLSETAVPEPATIALGALSLGALMVRRRR